MNLKDAKKVGVEYCIKNNIGYSYISYDDVNRFSWSEKEDNHTVFFINKNGSLRMCRATEYAVYFHKELKKRKKLKKASQKKKITQKRNRSYKAKSYS